jgi:hypothetical protein
MADVSLSLPERSALIALMTIVKEATNNDVHEAYHFKIDKNVRERLIELGYITAHPVKELRGAYLHELTEEGWRHCREEFAADVPTKAPKADRLLSGVLHRLEEFMNRSHVEIADVFAPPDTDDTESAQVPESVDEKIRSLYNGFAARPGAWVSLSRLRDALSEISRDEIDEALLRLDLQPQVYLISEANQKTLSPADRKAAIHIGGEDKHLLSIERG